MAGLQTNVYVAAIVTWTAALVALVLRVIARRITKQRWWVDDYFCVCAFIFASSYNILMIIWAARWNLGQTFHPSITEDQRVEILEHGRRLMLCCEYFYAFSIASTKFTILTLYWRLFKLSWIRIPIQIMFVISAMWIILRTFMVSFQCIPTRYFWDKSINGHCAINESKFFFGTILAHCVMDIIILALPIIEICKLHLRPRQKLAVIGLFLVGFIVCLASIITIVESIRFNPQTTELPRDVALGFIWRNVEINVAIVSACFPLLRPIFRRIFPYSFIGSYSRSQSINRAGHIHPIKLSTIPRTSEGEADDSSSTRQLSNHMRGLHNSLDFGHGQETIQTVISSHLRDSRSYTGIEHDMPGIYVRNDMVVEVEEVERSYAMKI
ncbi:hypothetical protein BGZ61DRAFT_391910 [Ilyonectria robusta]|uniref:uncharacterized protein n=1 Tax=Ilyonectria robusta TaxID=1079257 RepID=UPI001E8E7315|nr:uncharacterized protein BGZ61DRAFT_391910 [Ilyonectria robusta]KAH8688524.1 hypothetical protein BGZ61DRAFT_391910 [Ilyonectria robusta]